MHDVDGHLAVVQAGHVHPKPLRSDELGREFGRLSHDDDPALAEGERDALRPTGGRGRLAIVSLVERCVAELEDGNAPGRPLERLTGEGLDAIDPLGIVPPLRDRVIAQEVVLAGENQARQSDLDRLPFPFGADSASLDVSAKYDLVLT